MNGPKVTIQLTCSHGFDGNKLCRELAKKLGNKGYSYSQRNNDGTLNLSYEGSVQSVSDAIDFGEVTQVDEAQRTITVTIP